MSLFDETTRPQDNGSDYSEPHYDYLNRSGRLEAQIARRKMDNLFSMYETLHPKSSDDLKNRIKSSDNRQHLGAVTELYVHGLLLRNDFVVRPHPEVPGKKARPDFFASKSGVELYIEVAAIIGGPDSTRTATFEANILDSINEVSSANFLLGVDFMEVSYTQQPTLGKIRQEIQKFVDSLVQQPVDLETRSEAAYPSFVVEQGGWKMKFTAYPVTGEARERRRGTKTRSVGSIMYPVMELRTDEAIRNKIKEKRKKYGNLARPLIVAINPIHEGFFVKDDTVMRALFGKETLTFINHVDGTQETRHGRNMDGAWVRPPGTLLGGVSAVLVLPNLYAWNLDRVEPKLWIHPKPNYPIAPGILNVLHKVHNSKTSEMEDADFRPEQEVTQI